MVSPSTLSPVFPHQTTGDIPRGFPTERFYDPGPLTTSALETNWVVVTVVIVGTFARANEGACAKHCKAEDLDVVVWS